MEQTEVSGMNNSSRTKIFGVLVLAALIIGAVVFLYIRHTKLYVSTDDAYVTGRIHSIAPKVSGTVKALYVRDNQFVTRGTLLLTIDSADYDVRVGDARATVDVESNKLSEYAMRVEVAEKQLAEILSRIDTAKAAQALQEANLRQAALDLERARRLYDKGVLAEATLEKATTAHDVARAQVDAAREQVAQAYASLETQKLVVEQAKTALRSQGSVVEQKRQVLASEVLKQGYTKIYSPAQGYVTRKTAEVGNQVAAGQPLMVVVPLSDVWIVANYKETQLTDVRPGQKVTIRVDTYPGKTFAGTVESIMAGTGSVFSLFPPENATGNYVKVVQRIPVKIVLDKGTDPGHVLRVGMSVEPTIAVRN